MTTTKTILLELTGIRPTDYPSISEREYVLEGIDLIEHPNFKEKRYGWVFVSGRYYCDWVQYV